MCVSDRERRRRAHDRVTARFVLEEALAEDESAAAAHVATAAAGASEGSSGEAKEGASEGSAEAGAGAPVADAAASVASTVTVVPLPPLAGGVLEAWQFLTAYSEPLRLRRVPPWQQLHEALFAAAGQNPPPLFSGPPEKQTIADMANGHASSSILPTAVAPAEGAAGAAAMRDDEVRAPPPSSESPAAESAAAARAPVSGTVTRSDSRRLGRAAAAGVLEELCMSLVGACLPDALPALHPDERLHPAARSADPEAYASLADKVRDYMQIRACKMKS